MLYNVQEMEGFGIRATDGVIGQVRDFYFDDEAWVIRYLVVDTGPQHGSRKVLISPIALGTPNWSEKLLAPAISRAQVENSPDIDTDKPVSRQHEAGYLGYYGYTNYWGGGGLWGAGIHPDILLAGMERNSANTPDSRPSDSHLRSVNAVRRYYVHAKDGDIGHVQGFLIEEKTWAVRYIVVNTSNWWLGHAVLISPAWIEDVYWAESKLVVSVARQAVKDAPSYDPNSTLDRAQEEGLHAHHGRGAYWSRDKNS